jgi:hypothetical protein
MQRAFYFLMVSIIVFGCSDRKARLDLSPIVFDVWYGDRQEFGKLGNPQRWINILGNVISENGIKNLSYSLNESEFINLSLGSDLHRLAKKGDFNIDLALEDCISGGNILVIQAEDSAGNILEKPVQLVVEKRMQWPLPYSITWAEVKNIQDVLQVVDGQWEVTDAGLQNIDIYYDRVVALGDDSWENYELTTTVNFHGFTPPVKGPPTYNVSHAAIASRWNGHDVDELQPNRKWFPLGATSEFRLTDGLDSCRWRIFDGPKPGSINFHVEQPVEDFRHMELNTIYGMKHRVETIGRDSTRYSVKLWPIDQPEPDDWDFFGIEAEENYSSGSALLIAHNTWVTFGDITVEEIHPE